MDTLGIRSKVSCSSFLLFFLLPAPRGDSWFFLTPAVVKKFIRHCAVPSIVSLSANITRTAGATNRLREAQTCSSLPRRPSFTQMLVQHFPTTSQYCAKKDEQDTDLNPKFNREEQCANKLF